MKKLSSLLFALMLMVSGISFAQTETKSAIKARPATAQSKHAKEAKKESTAAPVKKDGTPDKRYKQNKNLKKDGTPDKRYKENKTAHPAVAN